MTQGGGQRKLKLMKWQRKLAIFFHPMTFQKGYGFVGYGFGNNVLFYISNNECIMGNAIGIKTIGTTTIKFLMHYE
jgi:hypothetical protein